MEKRKFRPAELLRSFELVQQYGVASSDGWWREYGPIKVRSGIDGYTITLENRRASVTVNFHNTLSFSTTDGAALESLHRDIANVSRELNEVA